MGNFVDTAQESAKEFGSAVTAKAEEAWDTSKRTAQEFASSAEDAFQTVSGFVGRYPGYAMLLAFGAGFILAEALHGFSSRQTRT